MYVNGYFSNVPENRFMLLKKLSYFLKNIILLNTMKTIHFQCEQKIVFFCKYFYNYIFFFFIFPEKSNEITIIQGQYLSGKSQTLHRRFPSIHLMIFINI